MRLRGLVLATFLIVSPAMASGQEATVGTSVGVIRMRSEASAGTDVLRGPALSVRATGWLGRLGMSLLYTGGRAGDAAQGTRRDIANGALLAAFRAFPYVTALAGVHAMAQVSDAGTSRYAFAQVGLQTRVPLGPWLSAHGGLWVAAAGTTNLAAEFGAGRGGSAGVTMRLPRTSLQIDLAYRIDRGTAHSPTVAESLETLSVALEVGLR